MKKVKKKSRKKPTRNELDKMSFEKRERVREQLRKEAVYTRSFKTPQSFGAASPVRRISVEDYLKEKANEH
jgi:hypothetical protein